MATRTSPGTVMLILAMLLLALAPMPALAQGTDVVTNGAFASDTSAWAFTAVAGNPSGSWDSQGQADGGAAKVRSETGAQKSGTGRWEQDLGSLGGGATVQLSYAWKKAFDVKKPQKQDVAVRIVKPDGAVADLDVQPGAPAAYNTWYSVAGKDVSSAFAQTGAYKLRLEYAYKTGSNGQASASAWFDQMRIEVATSAGAWVERAAAPAPGAYGEAVAGTGDALYVVRCTSATATPELRKYDPVANSWSSRNVSGLPSGALRNGATLVWDGGDHLYALGGARYTDADRRAFFRYTISSDSWAPLADSPAPQGAGDAMTWHADAARLFAILGSKEHGTAFASYDPGSDSWSSLAAPPAGTDDGASLAWAGEGSLYALRGEFYETSPPVQDFWRYDVAADTWASLADIPETDGVGDGGSLFWPGAFNATQGGVLYALGGGDPNENPGSDVYRYNLSNDAWETLPDLPWPVGNFNGNRLGWAGDYLQYWQGSPSTFSGGGAKTARFELAG